MPLKSGKSDKTRSANIAELMKAYKDTGKIGNTKPRNSAHAQEIASAIAYGKQKEAITESMKSFLDGLDTDNKTLIEAVKKAFVVCMEADVQPDVVNIPIPMDAKPEDLSKIQTLSADVLDKAKKAADIRANVDQELDATKQQVSKIAEEIKNRNASTQTNT